MSLPLIDAHSLVCKLIIHAGVKSISAGRELGKRLLLGDQSWRNVRAMAWTDVGVVI